MTGARLVVVHGLFTDGRSETRDVVRRAGIRRCEAVAEHGDELGVVDHEWVDGGAAALTNRLSRMARKTAPAVDAAEVVVLDDTAARTALADPSVRECLREHSGCARDGFDPARSFVLAGRPLPLLDGPRTGQRVLWFGYGVDHLDEHEFIDHYTGHHGPLVAGHAALMGLRRYHQVPNEERELGDSLCELGWGQAPPPAVFAELYNGRPALDPRQLRAMRSAMREIRTDERRHIDFGRSMLLLARGPAEREETTT